MKPISRLSALRELAGDLLGQEYALKIVVPTESGTLPIGIDLKIEKMVQELQLERYQLVGGEQGYHSKDEEHHFTYYGMGWGTRRKVKHYVRQHLPEVQQIDIEALVFVGPY